VGLFLKVSGAAIDSDRNESRGAARLAGMRLGTVYYRYDSIVSEMMVEER
jgi:hypothetical protein